MAAIPKKVLDRFASDLGRYQKILQSAKDRDVNESDTVVIVTDILSSLFGFDKYAEVTSEFAIRCTFCDLAVKVDGAVKYLIEVKAIGLTLKENHLKQAVDYAANQGIDWVVLTNGVTWSIHKIRFERPIDHDLVCEFNLLELSARRLEDQEKLFLLCREGITKAAIEEFHQHRQTVNRFMISQLVLTAPVLETIRRELRRVSDGIRVEIEEIETILLNEVLKREVIDSESAKLAKASIKKAATKALRVRTQASVAELSEPNQGESTIVPLASTSVEDETSSAD